MKFLFVAIVLGVAFVQHIRKETAQKASKKTLEPAPGEPIPERQRASMSRPKKMPPEPEKTAVQKDKERKWRRLANARRRTEH